MTNEQLAILLGSYAYQLQEVIDEVDADEECQVCYIGPFTHCHGYIGLRKHCYELDLNPDHWKEVEGTGLVAALDPLRAVIDRLNAHVGLLRGDGGE